MIDNRIDTEEEYRKSLLTQLPESVSHAQLRAESQRHWQGGFPDIAAQAEASDAEQPEFLRKPHIPELRVGPSIDQPLPSFGGLPSDKPECD